jgi:acylphosphatase
MKSKAHVFVSGNVQGVFFRSETKYKADKHHVTGWIRNIPDGRVEATFEGEEEDVRKLIEFCRTGPPAARINTVTITWQRYAGDYTSFEIT